MRTAQTMASVGATNTYTNNITLTYVYLCCHWYVSYFSKLDNNIRVKMEKLLYKSELSAAYFQ